MTQARPFFVRIDLRAATEIARCLAANHLARRLAALGDEGMASGIDEGFDIDALIAETAAPPSATPIA